MLVLTRRKNQSIIIADDITVVVVEVRGDKVRLGIEAPAKVPVWPWGSKERRPPRTMSDALRPDPGQMPRTGLDSRATLDTPTHDGLRCPECQSEQVELVRLKAAFEGKELVRWRKCLMCDHEFHTLERVAEL
jgi:DNA-directed RNA polymerase subunit M/transcription elongation factor TFIIS